MGTFDTNGLFYVTFFLSKASSHQMLVTVFSSIVHIHPVFLFLLLIIKLVLTIRVDKNSPVPDQSESSTYIQLACFSTKSQKADQLIITIICCCVLTDMFLSVLLCFWLRAHISRCDRAALLFLQLKSCNFVEDGD